MAEKNKRFGDSLIKNESTRLRFSVWVIIANFVLGIVGMIVGADLTALGVFLSLSNAPLYVYVLGRSFRPAQVPDEYFKQQHGGAGGVFQGGGNNYGGGNNWNDGAGGGGYDPNTYSPQKDDYNIPTNLVQTTETPKPVKTVKKDNSEIG